MILLSDKNVWTDRVRAAIPVPVPVYPVSAHASVVRLAPGGGPSHYSGTHVTLIYTNGYPTRHPQHRIPPATHRPISVNGTSCHLPPTRMGYFGETENRRHVRSASRSSPWPGFPYTETKGVQTEEKAETVVEGGMTIDSLLQQLRALS